MSVQSEITRIKTNVQDTLTAISEKGVTVPSNSTSNDMASLVRNIETRAQSCEDLSF